MKKILFITPNLSIGGTNSSLLSLINNLKNNGFNIHVFAITHQGDEKIKENLDEFLIEENQFLSSYYCNYSLLKTKTIKIFLIKFIKRLFFYLKINIEDFILKLFVNKFENQIEFHTVVGYQEGTATKLASKFKTSNKIAWIHCNYDYYLPRNKTEEKIYDFFNTIVLVSNYTKTVFCNRYPKLKEKTIVFYNLINASKVIKLSKNKININNYNNDIFKIISVGRIDPIKRFSLIPEISNQLLNKGLSFKWFILGSTDNYNELIKIKSKIAAFNLENIVHILGNISNPYPYFIHSDLLVSLSISEACPMIFNEAKILNLPIVTTDFPSSFEFITHEKDGLISTIDKLGEQIERMIEDKKLYSNIKINNSSFYIENDSMINKLISIF